MDVSKTEPLAQPHERWQSNWPAGVSREPHDPFGEIALSEYLRAWARRQPDEPAVIFRGLELSYGERDRRSDRFAALLASLGAEPGDRIAVFLPNCPQFLVAFFGILKAGWGMTETHTFDTFMTGMQDNDTDLASQPIFVGLPMPGTEFKICDFDIGRPQTLGTEGEIVVRSPSPLKRYRNKPEATAQALHNGACFRPRSRRCPASTPRWSAAR
jgi:acyl-CoA synthetase (AMP-forming)/AMP-acid ligase II